MDGAWGAGLSIGLPALVFLLAGAWKLVTIATNVGKVMRASEEQTELLRDFSKRIATVDEESEAGDRALDKKLQEQGGKLHGRINEIVQAQQKICRDQMGSCREEFRALGKRLDDHLAKHRNGTAS